MTPNPSENYEKSEGYFFRPFRNVDNSNFSNFSKLKQVLIPSLSANVDISEGAIRPQAHHDGELVTANHDGEQLAERRIGEFSRELETQQGGETRFGTHHYGENQTKTQALKDVGIDIAHALDAERKMGETLLETDRAKGARLEGKNIGGTPIQPPKDGTPTLAEIGVTKHGVSYD